MTTHTQDGLAEALQALLASDSFFPAADIDASEVANLRTVVGVTPKMVDHCTVQSGQLSQAGFGGCGADDWEMEAILEVVYLAQSADKTARRHRRRDAVAHLTALIAAHHDLGLNDPQVYAEIAPDVLRDDDVLLNGSAPASEVRIPISVTFLAASAAG